VEAAEEFFQGFYKITRQAAADAPGIDFFYFNAARLQQGGVNAYLTKIIYA